MACGHFPLARMGPAKRLALGAVFLCLTASLPAPAAPQADPEISPEAMPQIQQIDPNQAAPGAHLTVAIQGSNFSSGAYVASVSAALHVDSSKRVSATQLDAQVSVSASAQPCRVSLLVSNPASRVAESAFSIIAGQAPTTPASPPESVEPSKPATPGSPQAPAAPTPEVNPAAPAAPPTPAAPPAPPGPEVTTVEPSQVGLGYDINLKITGKNFVPGTKVSFANPGVHVLGITSPSSTELTVHIKVGFDADPSVASLFVFNPDDSEVEAPFEVTGKRAAKRTTPVASVLPTAPGSPDTLRYSAFHLGSPTEALQTHGKVKGLLVASSGTIQYQEDGKTLINVSMSEIKEIKVSSIATATFHITTTSGKTFHFAPGSLRPSDARIMADSLRAVLPHKDVNQ